MKRACFFFLASSALAVACGGSSSVDPTFLADAADDTGLSNVDGGADSATSGDDTGGADSGFPFVDGGADTGNTITRLPCDQSSALSSDLPFDQSGALEADLVAIGCPGDDNHLHVQLAVAGKRYDVALVVNDPSDPGNPPVGIFTKDLPSGGAPYGWSNAGFSYTQNLVVHSGDFTMLAKGPMLARLKTELANAGRVSVHGKSYSDGTGVHDVHWYNSTEDGVVIVRGGGAGGQDHVIAMRYSSMTF